MLHTVLNELQRFAESCGAHDKVAAQAPFLRECRGKFETDDDSFDTTDHGWKVALKTNGITHRWFGILIALSQYRVAMEQQERRYEKDHEGTFTGYRGVEE
jgi:hypothetical protein